MTLPNETNLRRERNYPLAPAFEYFVINHQTGFLNGIIIAGFVSVEDAWNFAEECQMANGIGHSYTVVNLYDELQPRG